MISLLGTYKLDLGISIVLIPGSVCNNSIEVADKNQLVIQYPFIIISTNIALLLMAEGVTSTDSFQKMQISFKSLLRAGRSLACVETAIFY